jgi:hypothetical protein
MRFRVAPGILLQEVYSITQFREWQPTPACADSDAPVIANELLRKVFRWMNRSEVLGNRQKENKPMRNKAVYLWLGVALPLAYLANSVTGATALMDEPAPMLTVGNQVRGNPILLSSKVFTLKAADISVVEDKIRGLLDPPESLSGHRGIVLGGLMPGSESIPQSGPNINGGAALGGGLPTFGMFGLAGGGVPIGAGQPNPGSAPGIGGGFGGTGGLGALGFAGVPTGGMLGRPVQASAAATWRMVTDERTRSVIFRGNADELQTVTEIVSLAELKANQPLPALHRLGAFRLKYANAGDLVEKLSQLEINIRLCPLEGSNIIAALGSEAARQEVGDLIKALDIEVKEN